MLTSLLFFGALLGPACTLQDAEIAPGQRDLTPMTLELGADGESQMDPEVIVELASEARRALAEGAGIKLPDGIPLVLLTMEEATQRRRAYTADLEDETGLTVAVDMLADLMFSDNMLGRYLPDEQVVYLIEDVIMKQGGDSDGPGQDLLFGVLAHELVHAYDDFMYDGVPDPRNLAVMLEDPSRMGEVQTHMALVEGRATWAAELASIAAGREPLSAPTLESTRSARYFEGDQGAGSEVVAGAGNAMVRLKLAQYAYGRLFAKAAWEFGREPFFAEVFEHGPLSYAELEDFNEFKMRWAEEQSEELDAADDVDA
ncbi:MAG: hypothetical protein DHS20C15_03150 [Planctomycetota bacterium]|nr:MAG: hypothetical protein DHS20C15_03150 [Planctomycetota bacterium]